MRLSRFTKLLFSEVLCLAAGSNVFAVDSSINSESLPFIPYYEEDRMIFVPDSTIIEGGEQKFTQFEITDSTFIKKRNLLIKGKQAYRASRFTEAAYYFA